jgi:hypothetical protein
MTSADDHVDATAASTTARYPTPTTVADGNPDPGTLRRSSALVGWLGVCRE